MHKSVAAAVALCLVTGRCSTGHVEPPAFNGSRAFSYLERQVSFGSRVPGSPASAACRNFCAAHFDSCGMPVDSQLFTFFDPYSKQPIRMVNLLAHFSGRHEGQKPLLLVAHYDSRPRTDLHSDPARRNDPLIGANDGASGVAVLLELAMLFRERPPDIPVDLLLVDGEDWGEEGDLEHYLLGSRYFAAQGIRDRYRFGIVVDMIGDRDQQIYREGYSDSFHKPLNDMLWHAAARLGVTTLRDSVKQSIIDDHLSLNTGGVPSVVLIDFDFPYWHTEKDTPDKCSPEALANVGRVLAEIVYNKSLWPRH